ncbi:elongation factor 4, partial [Veillonellaceae bacterium M2-8]|nr:elongation factor 4 [Veillonellaceae bacterium M2-8]
LPLVSAKNDINTEDVLEAIVNNIPAPVGDSEAPLKALIFDSYYDGYKGVVAYVRVFEGTVKKGMTIEMMNSKKKFEVTEVGVMAPNATAL